MRHNAFLAIFPPSFFLLRIDHKPLKWLTTIFDIYGRRGRWISMLQDFQIKIVHSASSKHANVDVLSRNPVDRYKINEDFGNEIQDLEGIT
jgi:hypothetical protein